MLASDIFEGTKMASVALVLGDEDDEAAKRSRF